MKNKNSVPKIDKIQVGCGPHNLMKGWWNVDIRDFKGIDQVMDVAKPWPWKKCIKYVYGEHFIEHLSLEQAIRFMTFAGNALVVGGKIRLSTPNLTWVMMTHYKVKEGSVSDTMSINRAFHGWGHQFLWSGAMFEYVLKELGFKDVTFFNYGESNDKELVGIERHGGGGKVEGVPTVIVVEATRQEKDIKATKKFLENVDEQYIRYVQSGH